MVSKNNVFMLAPAEQLASLRVDLGELPDFNPDFIVKPLPDKAANNFVVPQWSILAPTYLEALDKVHQALAAHLEFTNGLNLSHGERQDLKFLRPQFRTVKGWEKMVQAQQCGVVIVPAQFTGHYQDLGFRNLYTEKMNREDEFGLDPYTVAIVLLSHQYLYYDGAELNLDIRCAGAHYPPRNPPDADSSSILYFLKSQEGKQELFLSSNAHTFSDAEGWATGYIL
ncbi:MAG: hypothetical protein WCO55_04025 [Candidatus Falkowbacteria bacterium]